MFPEMMALELLPAESSHKDGCRHADVLVAPDDVFGGSCR